MRALLLLAGALTAACSPWPAPTATARWPEPKGLGTFIVEGAPLRATTLDVVAKNDRVYVLQTLGPGYTVDLVLARERTTTVLELDPATNKVTTLPAPPFDVDALWPSDEPVGMLASQGPQIASFDGSTWTTLPPLPSPGLVFMYRADARRVFARTTATSWLYADGSWHDLALALGSGARSALVLGPWSSTAVRLVWIENGATQHQACSQLVDTTSLSALGAPVCKDALWLSKFLGDAINGTVDDFQVVFTDDLKTALVWRFSGGAWSRGALISAGAVRATPGSKDLCVDTLSIDVGATTRSTPLMRVSGGQPVETLFIPSFSLLGCTGDERTCARHVDLVLQGVNRDCTATWLLTDNFIDARRRAYAKKFDLPFRDAVTCTPACSSRELCLATSETAGVCALDPVSNSTATQMPASLVLRVEGSNGTPVLPELSFTAPDTGLPLTGFTTQVLTGSTLVSGPPGTPVTMTVHASGHADRAFTFTMPNENTQADLGTVYLMRGTRLGLAPAGVSRSTVLASDAGASLVLPLASADGGVSMTQVLEAADGGVLLRALTGSDATASAPVVSPDGRWLLWTDARGLSLLDLATQQRHPVTSTLGAGWQLASTVFSGDGSTVAISLGAGTSVHSLAAPPVERFVANAVGTALQLSRDGSTLLHHAPAGWTLTTVSGSFVASNAPSALLSGDGARLYSTSGSFGALTLSVQPTTLGATSTPVATGVRAVTIDPGGGDALFDSFSSGATTVSRISGSTVSVVQAGIPGQAEALTAGALWVRDTSSTTVFFPFATATGRVFTGNHGFFFDDRHALLSAKGLLITATSSRSLPPGPGVFSFDSTRRINPASRSISTLSGNTEVSVKSYASPNLTPTPAVDARFTDAGGRQSYFAPCALFSVGAKSFSITPSGGAVTFLDAGTEVYCVR